MLLYRPSSSVTSRPLTRRSLAGVRRDSERERLTANVLSDLATAPQDAQDGGHERRDRCASKEVVGCSEADYGDLAMLEHDERLDDEPTPSD